MTFSVSATAATTGARFAVTTDKADAAVRLRLRGAARALWTCRDEEVVIEGPAGTGKSYVALEKVHAAALQYPGCRIAMVRKTRASMTESTLVTFEQQVLGEGHPVLADGPSRGGRRSYVYPPDDYGRSSEIVVGGLDRPSRIMSTQYDMVYVAEATETFEHDWEMLSTRLRNGVMPFQQIIGDINPDAPSHWLHQRCDQGRATVLFSRHEDNPALWDEVAGDWTAKGAAYIARLDRLTGVRRDRLRFGRRATADGTVYEFDRAVHLIDPFPIPADWPRYRVVDFGYVHPFVCQWWAEDPDGRIYLYREIYRTRRTVTTHAPQIKALSEGESYVLDLADHDAEDRATLAENGIRTKPANKAITTGIQAVEDRLKVQGDGKPRLFIMRGALVESDPELAADKRPLCTEQEFDVYVYPKGSDGKPAKEAPVKANDHGMDAMRYVCAALARRAARGNAATRLWA